MILWSQICLFHHEQPVLHPLRLEQIVNSSWWMPRIWRQLLHSNHRFGVNGSTFSAVLASMAPLYSQIKKSHWCQKCGSLGVIDAKSVEFIVRNTPFILILGKKRIQCNVCLKTFCDKGSLNIHFSAVHLREMHKCSVEGKLSNWHQPKLLGPFCLLFHRNRIW